MALLLAVASLAAAFGLQGADANWLLEKGIYLEETRGEIKEAAKLYEQIVGDPKTDRSLIAQAQLRLGLCQLKLGNKPQAISAFERLTQEFPDKDKLLGLVEQHMPQLLDEMLKQIEQNYIHEVERGELMETALRAIVGKLDARGFLRTNDMEFLNRQEVAQLNEGLEQKIAGVGAVLVVKDGDVLVRTPLAGSPALEAGVLAGDRIVSIDGADLPVNQLATAVKLLRGPIGTPVTLGVKRAGSDELIEIQLVRNTIRLPSVKGIRYDKSHRWDFMADEEKKIGYVRLTQLGKQSPEEMSTALNDLKAQGMKAFILDLRHNPGGTLAEAVAVADLFVETGRIVTVKGRAGETVYDAQSGDGFTNFPMAVLVNRFTASAAEIVAACLQDHRRALVIGERTFGQGIVRSLVPLKGNLGALKLPVAAYYRPSGQNMNRYPEATESDDWGVTPDAGYEVVLTENEMKAFLEDRAAREILNKVEASAVEFDDRQLKKAIDWVRAQLEEKAAP